MNQELRIQAKTLGVILGIGFLVLLVLAGILVNNGVKEQPQGEYITREDADILMEAAGEGNWKGNNSSEEVFVIYDEVQEYFQGVSNEPIIKEILQELKKKYQPKHFLLREDWYKLYDGYVKLMGLEQSISRIEITSLGAESEVTEVGGIALGEKTLLSEEGVMTFCSSSFRNMQFLPIIAYLKAGILLTVYETKADAYQIKNAWVMELAENDMHFFWKDYEIKAELGEQNGATSMDKETKEQVADLSFEQGKLTGMSVKMNKVNGKILSISEEAIEVEKIGTLPFSEHLKIYQIYDTLSVRYTGDLRIGYDFADFVIEDGKVEACLITRDEAMENIRVLIQNSNYGGRLHEDVTLTADTDFVIEYGSYDRIQAEQHQAGEIVQLTAASDYFTGERVKIIPVALTGKVELLSVERNQGIPKYRGQLEIVKVADGLAVINELLLEEYLYCVVPSEMPASYPLEALKAQAVCARTYAYRKMLKSGLPEYGAHVDDSTSFQVYNNISENKETTKAVRETKGKLLYAQDELVDAYYYSTSCGFGTNSEIWKSGAEPISYLQAKRIGSESTDVYTEKTMMEEEIFCEYISQVHESDYESQEGWYRWSYIVEKLDCEVLYNRICERKKATSGQILVEAKDGSFVDKTIEAFLQVKEISVGKRGMGGVLDEIIIETDTCTVKVIGEYNIRYVLNNGKAKVYRQGGSESASPTLLPSAFLTIKVIKDGNDVTGYEIKGGGFGHGVGMSQNGARNMALSGMDAAQILTFFYDGSSVNEIY